jgi:ech hydrogenase subunit A
MQTLILSLFILPFVVSGLILVAPKSIMRVLTIASVLILSGLSVYLFLNIHEPVRFALDHIVDKIIVVADILLLLYFGFVAIKRKSWIVGVMTVLQLGTLLYLISIMPSHEGQQILVDKLSLFMYLLINIISGVIAVYSLKYIDEEECTDYRKRFFMSVMMWFIGVMNFIVSVDNMEYFFLLFELTTLASYLFISFRKDEISVKNALQALWMNQIGGLGILLAMIVCVTTTGIGTVSFTDLIQNGPAVGVMLPFALLAVAALIKGAQMPFSNWLLGAMVAPTPVSALLHSSTMVKIAPFLILRLSPAIKGTPISTVIIALTAFVFIVAAISALSQDNFKRILAYSTIALLGLMIMMAAIGTETAVVAALILIMFHGISKCMLFLNAGILERVFHLKQASDMDKLGETGPYTAFVVAMGFMSLMLPPFGAFIGKWFSIEILGASLKQQMFVNAMVIVCIAIGGAVLSLLYFKVLGVLISRSGKTEKVQFEKMSPFYKGNINFLMFLILASIIAFPWLISNYFAPVAEHVTGLTKVAVDFIGTNVFVGNAKFPMIPMILAFVLLPLSLILAMFVKFKKVDRVKEYMCGEKIDYKFSSFYFSFEKYNPYFIAIGGAFFIALVVVGGMI